MKLFYIETSSSYLYTGIVSNGNLLASCKSNYAKDLSKFTLVEIEKIFIKSKLTPEDIDKIIVVSGPGSFTGIRIGMTFAKIFAHTMNKNITTITSLDAMSASVKIDELKVPIINARRGYVFAGVYDHDKIILENQYMKLEDLIAYLNNLDREYQFIKNDSIFDFDNIIEYDTDILSIVNKYQNKDNINPHLVEPSYLKLTEAEEKLGSFDNDN